MPLISNRFHHHQQFAANRLPFCAAPWSGRYFGLSRLRRMALARAMLWLLTLGAAAAISQPAFGQPALSQPVPQPGASAPSFSETLDVRVIHVETVVTRGGDRVTDLGADDFELRVDGERRDIEFFSEVRGGERYASNSLSTGSASPGAASQPAVTRYLLFIDDDFALPNKRNRLLQNLVKQIDTLAPQDRMAVVAWNGEQVELLSSWLSAGRELKEVLAKAQQRTVYGLKRRSEFRRWESEQRAGRSYGGSSFSSIGFAGANRSYGSASGLEAGSEAGRSIHRLSLALSSTLRGFAQADGRKVLLMLSGGLPAGGNRGAAGFSGFDLVDTLDDVERLFQPAVDTANRLGYTIYPVDLGDGHGALASAEFGSLNRVSIQRDLEDQRNAIEQGALHFFAEQTGGEVLFGGSGKQVLARVAADTRSYYVLGFTPDWQYDDASHRVEVKLVPQAQRATSGSRGKRARKAKVRTRRSFSDLSRQSRITMAVDSAHLFDLPLPDAQDFAVSLGQPTRVGVNKMDVPVSLSIPLDGITFLPSGGVQKASLELRIAATDKYGNAAQVPVVPVLLERGDDGEQGIAVWETSMRLRRLPHRLLIAVHDPLSDVILARRLDVQP